jgi:hypothetical protein
VPAVSIGPMLPPREADVGSATVTVQWRPGSELPQPIRNR